LTLNLSYATIKVEIKQRNDLMKVSDWDGVYEYKGFTIWNPAEKEWIAEPNWCIKAIESYKGRTMLRFLTIAKAKKWIREEGIHLKEEDYL
jgi:hypothetical protein